MKRIISLALVFVLMFAFATTTFADDAITPRYNNTQSVELSLAIDENGKATIHFDCQGIMGVTTRINAVIKLQKKFLFWWTDVNDAYWNDTYSNHYFEEYRYFNLSSGGEYKLVITFTVYGSGGEADVFTRETTATY